MNRFYDYACCFHEKTKEIIWLAFDSNLLQTPVVKPSRFPHSSSSPRPVNCSLLFPLYTFLLHWEPFLYRFFFLECWVIFNCSYWTKYRFTAPELHAVFLGYHVERGWVKEISLNNLFHLKLQNVEQKSFRSSMARVLAWPRPGTPRSITWLLCCRSTDQLGHPGEARQAVVCLQSPWSGGWCPSPPPPPPSPPPNSLSCFQSSLFSTRLAPYCSTASPTPPTQPCPRAVPAAPGMTWSTSGTPCGRGTNGWRTSR